MFHKYTKFGYKYYFVCLSHSHFSLAQNAHTSHTLHRHHQILKLSQKKRKKKHFSHNSNTATQQRRGGHTRHGKTENATKFSCEQVLPFFAFFLLFLSCCFYVVCWLVLFTWNYRLYYSFARSFFIFVIAVNAKPLSEFYQINGSNTHIYHLKQFQFYFTCIFLFL